MRRALVIVLVALSAAVACDGAVKAPAKKPAPGIVDPGHNQPPPPAPGTFIPADARLRRLLSWQYQSAISDILGPDAAAVVELPTDVALNGFATVGSAALSLSPGRRREARVERLRRVASRRA